MCSLYKSFLFSHSTQFELALTAERTQSVEMLFTVLIPVISGFSVCIDTCHVLQQRIPSANVPMTLGAEQSGAPASRATISLYFLAPIYMADSSVF